MTSFFTPPPAEHIKKERRKAKKLRSSKWWQNKLSLGVCYFCEKKFPKSRLTMEHLIPLVRGGLSIRANLAVCCKPCNSKKKHQTIIEKRLNTIK